MVSLIHLCLEGTVLHWKHDKPVGSSANYCASLADSPAYGDPTRAGGSSSVDPLPDPCSLPVPFEKGISETIALQKFIRILQINLGFSVLIYCSEKTPELVDYRLQKPYCKPTSECYCPVLVFTLLCWSWCSVSPKFKCKSCETWLTQRRICKTTRLKAWEMIKLMWTCNQVRL